jgi:hypothetical protein
MLRILFEQKTYWCVTTFFVALHLLNSCKTIFKGYNNLLEKCHKNNYITTFYCIVFQNMRSFCIFITSSKCCTIYHNLTDWEAGALGPLAVNDLFLRKPYTALIMCNIAACLGVAHWAGPLRYFFVCFYLFVFSSFFLVFFRNFLVFHGFF